MSWETIREVFYTIGSIAGLAAIGKPVFEQKFSRDLERAKYVLSLASEQDYLSLEFQIWHQRAVLDSFFMAVSALVYDLKDNSDRVRFSGPLASYFRKCCEQISESYLSLRELIQVNEWEPSRRDEETIWHFNKSAFTGPNGYPENYTHHLEECVDRARLLVKAYQRLQIVSEMHLYEAPLARWLLPRRYRQHGVENHN